MTVKLLAKWGEQPPGTLYVASTPGTETAMITAGQATANLTGAIPWVPPGGSPEYGSSVGAAINNEGNLVGLKQRTSPDVPIFETGITGGMKGDFVLLLGSYITVEDNMPSSASRLKGNSFANAVNNSHCYVDPVNGNDANTGYSPSAAKQTLNFAGWGGGTTGWNPQMFMLLKRGSDFTVNSIIGNLGTGLTGGMSLGSYGDPSLPKPIVRPTVSSLYNNAGLSITNPDGAVLSDVVIDCTNLNSGVAARNGVRFLTATNADVMRNVLVSGVEIVAPRTIAGTWVAGLAFDKRTRDNSSSAVARAGEIRVERSKVSGAGSHGILFTGALGYLLPDGTWGGVDVLDNEVVNCGLDYDSHGITSYGENVVKATGLTWTNTTSTIFWTLYSTPAAKSVFDVELCNILLTSRDSCTYHLEKNTATPTTPAPGEFGFDNATQRLYINVSATPTAADTLMAATQPPRGVKYISNRVTGMPYLGLTAGYECHGLTFDDWASDCLAIGNYSYNNGGFGLNSNKGSRNRFARNMAIDNRIGGIGLSGLGSVVEANYISGASSLRGGGSFRALIMQDTVNGPMGTLVTQIRRNYLNATAEMDAFIAQSDASGFRGIYTLAQGNIGIGPALQQTIGKVMSF